MKLAEKVISIHEDYKTLLDIVKSFLSKPNQKTKAVEDFFFDSDVSNFFGYKDFDRDGSLNTEDWEVELVCKKFSEGLLAYGEGEDVTIEDAKELAPKIPEMIKGKSFQIDSFFGKIKDSHGTGQEHIQDFIVAVKSSKYDDNKDILTVEVSIENAYLD